MIVHKQNDYSKQNDYFKQNDDSNPYIIHVPKYIVPQY